jgi:hypothetical protein
VPEEDVIEVHRLFPWSFLSRREKPSHTRPPGRPQVSKGRLAAQPRRKGPGSTKRAGKSTKRRSCAGLR